MDRLAENIRHDKGCAGSRAVDRDVETTRALNDREEGSTGAPGRWHAGGIGEVRLRCDQLSARLAVGVSRRVRIDVEILKTQAGQIGLRQGRFLQFPPADAV